MIEVPARILCDTPGCGASENIVIRSQYASTSLSVRAGVWEEGAKLPSGWETTWSKSENREYIHCPTCAKTHDARKRLEKATA